MTLIILLINKIGSSARFGLIYWVQLQRWLFRGDDSSEQLNNSIVKFLKLKNIFLEWFKIITYFIVIWKVSQLLFMLIFSAFSKPVVFFLIHTSIFFISFNLFFAIYKSTNQLIYFWPNAEDICSNSHYIIIWYKHGHKIYIVAEMWQIDLHRLTWNEPFHSS